MSEKSEQSENHSTEDEFMRCPKCSGEMKTEESMVTFVF